MKSPVIKTLVDGMIVNVMWYGENRMDTGKLIGHDDDWVTIKTDRGGLLSGKAEKVLPVKGGEKYELDQKID